MSRWKFEKIKDVYEVLCLYEDVLECVPVNWNAKDDVSEFKSKHDHYAKRLMRLSVSDQGFVCEQISNHWKHNVVLTDRV